MLQILYIDSNNAVNYEALLHEHWIEVTMSIKCLKVRGDSNLVISHVDDEFDAKDSNMKSYRNVVLKILTTFKGL